MMVYGPDIQYQCINKASKQQLLSYATIALLSLNELWAENASKLLHSDANQSLPKLS